MNHVARLAVDVVDLLARSNFSKSPSRTRVPNGAWAASTSPRDKVVSCLLGQAGVSLSLHKQIGTKVNAEAATDAAMKFADTRCKVRVQLGEGGRDYIYHSIHGIKKAWFNEWPSLISSPPLPPPLPSLL
jgi:hypothetical protein